MDDKHNRQLLKGEWQAKTYVLLHLLKPCPGLSKLRKQKSHAETFTFLNPSKPRLLHTSPACHSIRAWLKALVRVQDHWLKSGASQATSHILNTSSICHGLPCWVGFPGGSEGKESACNPGDLGSIPGSGRSPGEGNGNPHQYSCLENSVDGGAWEATVHGVAKSRTRLSDWTELNLTQI